MGAQPLTGYPRTSVFFGHAIMTRSKEYLYPPELLEVWADACEEGRNIEECLEFGEALQKCVFYLEDSARDERFPWEQFGFNVCVIVFVKPWAVRHYSHLLSKFLDCVGALNESLAYRHIEFRRVRVPFLLRAMVDLQREIQNFAERHKKEFFR